MQLNVLKSTHAQEYFEFAIEKAASIKSLHTFDIRGAKGIEIDFPEDLERARAMFA